MIYIWRNSCIQITKKVGILAVDSCNIKKSNTFVIFIKPHIHNCFVYNAKTFSKLLLCSVVVLVVFKLSWAQICASSIVCASVRASVNNFYTPRKISGEHIVVALSVRPSVCPGIPMGTCWVPKYLTNVHL